MVMRVQTLSAWILFGVVAAHLKIDVGKWGYAPDEVRNEQFTALTGVCIVACIWENVKEHSSVYSWYRRYVAAEEPEGGVSYVAKTDPEETKNDLGNGIDLVKEGETVPANGMPV